MAKIGELEQDQVNIIGNGTVIKGDVVSTGDMRIDGLLQGNLQTKGRLIIGATGKLIGEIDCKNSEISGTIEGKIVVGELLTLKSTAKIMGDIITSKLSIEPGAIFTGTCNMGGNQRKPEVTPVTENASAK
ncbi:MAG: polymer-forming cytoskeletal protein [Bacteroidales bacterium]|nr:polymer-forming cytoskeletal protein [Bacteroidales bacterium]HOY39535.1 polymer-forming cytoskeletal protein [Bacteroidales bacterium]HQP04609.1 polymer-forming cytoskeletal protein [Bacteroidales bacterium]